MWLFVIMYVMFLVLETIIEVIKLKKGKKDIGDSFLPTIFGFSFVASSIGCELITIENVPKILFVYSIVYAIYWMIIQGIKFYHEKNDN